MINEFNNYQNNSYAMQNRLDLVERFVCKHYDAWVDSEGNLYIQSEFCENGNLDNYMKYLERSVNITDDFYWDLIFELVCVSK